MEDIIMQYTHKKGLCMWGGGAVREQGVVGVSG